MRVRVISNRGEVKFGEAILSNGRGKNSVFIRFNEPLNIVTNNNYSKLSTGEEFYLNKNNQSIMIWGQGEEYYIDAWRLHEEDARTIVESGGG